MLNNLIERAYAVDSSTFAGIVQINESSDSFSGLIDQIISWILYIAFVLAFIYLVVAGITFITAGGNAEQAKKGQQGLIYAIIGIVVVTLSFVILKAANNLGLNTTAG